MKGGSFLETIVAATRKGVEERRARVPAERLLEAGAAPRGHRFVDALRRPGRVNVIAECKRRSPSRGVLRDRYDPAALARDYAEHGAAAVSVLTEPRFFGGSLEDLRSVRAAVDVPLLRKDFIVEGYQLAEACAAGADAVLLIVAALAPAEVRRLREEAEALGLAALVEVHDGAELARAVEAGATIVGVNARDLGTLEVDSARALELAAAIPHACVAVAESGLRHPGDVTRLGRAGYDAFLIGEHLLVQDAPGAALAALISAVEDARAGGDG